MPFRLFPYIFFLVISLPAMGLAADPSELSSSSTAEVIQKKIQEEASEEILARKEEEQVLIDEDLKPQPADTGVKFTLSEIRVVPSSSGAAPEIYEELIGLDFVETVTSQYENRETALSELQHLTRILEEGYRAKGYFAVVIIPPQKAEKGVLTLELLVSKMGDVEVTGNRWFRKARTKSYWGIPKGDALNYDAIRGSVAEMNQNPDRLVKPILKAGQEAGATDVILNVEDHFPLHAGYSLDNQGTKLTGKHRNGFTLRNNNMLGLDDIFLIGTSFGRHFGALFLQHLIPLNRYGTRFIWGYSHSEVEPKQEFESFGIHGMSEIYNLSVRQRLIRTQRLFIETYLGFDFKEQRTKQLSTTSNWTRLRVLSLGGVMQWADKWGVWAVEQDFFFGIPLVGDGFPLTSRQGESSFFKYGFALERTQKLFWGTQGRLHFEGQLSQNRLASSEQIFLGGMDSVRGYADNDYGADQGFFTRVEYQVPFYPAPKDWKMPYSKESVRDSVQLVTFFDHGYGFLRQADPGERTERTLMGVGAGFRMRFSKYLSGRFEWGVPLGDSGIVESGPSQFHFKFSADV